MANPIQPVPVSVVAERARFDHRHLLNGLIDRYVYGTGVVDTSLDFEELRRRSHINDAACAAGDAKDFSTRIRAPLPVPAPAAERRSGCKERTKHETRIHSRRANNDGYVFCFARNFYSRTIYPY
jgi:hypothetical protein